LYLRRAEQQLDPGAAVKQPKDYRGKTGGDLQNYHRAIEWFQKAAKLNQLRTDVWFSLGCAALRVEDWRETIRAFRMKLSYAGEDFQSWNNLGHAYVKLGLPKQGFLAFKQTIKSEYNNWKVRENHPG